MLGRTVLNLVMLNKDAGPTSICQPIRLLDPGFIALCYFVLVFFSPFCIARVTIEILVKALATFLVLMVLKFCFFLLSKAHASFLIELQNDVM